MNPVEPIAGEPLRFRVRSRSGRAGVGSYLVDLTSRNFFGSCGCDAAHFNPSERCYHVIIAREWFLDKLLRDIAAVRGGAAAEREQERSGA